MYIIAYRLSNPMHVRDFMQGSVDGQVSPLPQFTPKRSRYITFLTLIIRSKVEDELFRVYIIYNADNLHRVRIKCEP